MFVRWGYDQFAHNVRDRVDMVVSAVTVEVSVLTPEVRNDMTDRDWVYYVEKAIRTEFPGMSDLSRNERYVDILVAKSKKSVSFAFEWFGTNWPGVSYTDRLVELYHRSERDRKSGSREFDRIVQKAWRWAIRRSGWDYDRSVRFVQNVENAVLRSQGY